MDGDGDWITARYLLSAALGRHPLVVDHVDEESFPVDRFGGCPAEAVAMPPPAPAGEDVAGMVCTVCTEEMARGEAVARLSCAHWYHSWCIAPWLRIRGTCPMCRAELPRDGAGEGAAGAHCEKPHARASTATAAGSSRGGGAACEYVAGGVQGR